MKYQQKKAFDITTNTLLYKHCSEVLYTGIRKRQNHAGTKQSEILYRKLRRFYPPTLHCN